MKIKDITIKKFRRFENITIPIGGNITCLSGYNGIGKSTILGLLGHCGEIPKKDGETSLGKPFKADLSEMIKFSSKYDLSISDAFTLSFGNIPQEDLTTESYSEELSFRTTWQNHSVNLKQANKTSQKNTIKAEDSFAKQEVETGKKEAASSNTENHHIKPLKLIKKRYRIIPIKNDNRHTEKKLYWPTSYLGLSRLYPIGESDRVSKEQVYNKLTQEQKELIISAHREILSSNDEYKDFSALSISETDRKKGFGVITENYDSLTNSAGQDNLGQILSLLYSFKMLKEKMGERWIGGLLLIDEIDATLHPAAQNKLFDHLFKKAREYDIQIVFTTHSLSLLEHICKKCTNNKPNEINKIELSYLSDANGKVKERSNPKISYIRYDLTNSYRNFHNEINILIYSEDEETRWLFDKIISFAKSNNYIYNLDVFLFKHMTIDLGKNQLLKLLSTNYEYFSKSIILLDGDASDEEINKEINRLPIHYSATNIANNKVILKMPTSLSPEQFLWKYIDQEIDQDSPFFDQFAEDGISKRSFRENGPLSDTYQNLSKDRQKFKQWFRDNKFYLDALIDYWIRDHNDEFNKFLKSFQAVYNYAAKQNELTHIKLNI